MRIPSWICRITGAEQPHDRAVAVGIEDEVIYDGALGRWQSGCLQIDEPQAARRLEDVNSAIHEVETGQVKARLVFDLR